MLADLEQLIKLQQLEDAAAGARARVEEIPAAIETLGARIEAADARQTRAQQELDTSRGSRQESEKQAAAVQSRLDRFREQLMEVKTNREYQTMQGEIATAESEKQRLEDEILEYMLAEDDLQAALASARDNLTAEQRAVDAERAALEAERETLEGRLGELAEERTRHVATLAPQLLSLFETVAERRGGTVVCRARDGRCATCQVRLRPQLFNDVRANSRLIQCESCQRVLYFEEQAAAAAAPGGGAAA